MVIRLFCMRMWPVHALSRLPCLQRNRVPIDHRRSSRNGPKLEYVTGPINATLEQSFPPRNSIGKVGCCVLLLQSAVLVGSHPNPTFQADTCRIAMSNTVAQARTQLHKVRHSCIG